MDIVKLQ